MGGFSGVLKDIFHAISDAGRGYKNEV